MKIKSIIIVVFIILVSLVALSNALHTYEEGNITLEEHHHDDQTHDHENHEDEHSDESHDGENHQEPQSQVEHEEENVEEHE